MKASDLSILLECPKRYEFNQFGFKSEGSNYLKKNIVVKDIIKKAVAMDVNDVIAYLRGDAVTELQNALNEMVMPEVTRRVELETLIALITRYVVYVFQTGLKVVGNGFTKEIKVPDSSNLLTTGYDVAYLDVDTVEIVKIKISKPSLTMRGKSLHTNANLSMELYAMEQLGMELFPGKNVRAAFHHLSSKDDGTELAVFEAKPGKNIVTKVPNLPTDIDVAKNIATILDMSKENLECNTKACFTCQYKAICQNSGSKDVLEELPAIEKVQGTFSLTDTQKKAVQFEEGILRINAGAGSGKTTVLALRFGELVCSGVDPKNILLITFTNKGAGEMKEKVKYWLDKEGIDTSDFKFNIKTFNSFGGEVIAEHYTELGFTKKPVLLEKVQKYNIIMDILAQVPTIKGYDYKNPFMNFPNAKGVCVKIAEIFDTMKVKHLTTKNQVKAIAPEREEIILKMYDMFQDRLQKEGFIEYQDQINLVNKLINEDSSALNQYDYEHIIVDEFQDSDPGQLELVMFLTNQKSFKSLMIVGDDSQSIFGFRNTSQENILKFHTFFKNVEDIQMVENFRSTPQILNLANKINDLNEQKIDKTLVSCMPGGVEPTLYTTTDSNDVIYKNIVDEVKSRIMHNGDVPEKFAVIARTRKELLEIQEVFKTFDIPTIMAVPDLYINNTAVLLANKLASFIENRAYTQGLFEYLYVKENKFEGKTHQEIIKTVKEVAEEIDSSIVHSVLEPEDAKKDTFFKLIDEIADEDAVKFFKEIEEMPFNEIKEYLFKFVEYEDGKTVDVPEGNFKAVTLITAHTSKGKEYDVVFNILSKYKFESQKTEDIEELRRLLFVSVTRAKKELLLFTNLAQFNPFRNDFIPVGIVSTYEL